MINWTEEDVKFVCNTMIAPMLEQVTKLIELSNDSHSRTENSIVDALDKLTYQQTRELSFLKTIIINYCHLDPEKLELARQEYFKQFDELNKKKENEDA